MNKIILTSLFLISLPLYALNGALSEPHTISIENQCHSIVFKGRDHYKNVAYVMPQVILGQDQNGQSISQLFKNDQNYQFRFAVYFPHDLSEFPDQKGIKGCSHHTLKEELKRQDEKIYKISTLDIHNVKLSMRDFNDVNFHLAPESSALMDLKGQSRIAKLEMNRGQIQKFRKLLQTPTGVQIDVNFLFKLKASDGKIDCKLDNKQLLNNLTADLKYPRGKEEKVKGEKGVKTILDLEASVQKSVSQAMSQCYVEASTDDNFDLRVSNVINRLLSVARVNSTYYGPGGRYGGGRTGSTGGQTDQSELRRVITECREQTRESGGTREDMMVCVCNQIPDYSSCQNQNDGVMANSMTYNKGIKLPSWGELLGVLSETQLKLIYDHLKSDNEININISQVSTAKDESYSTSFTLRDHSSIGKFQETGVHSNQEYNQIGAQELKAGEELVIIPSKKIYENLVTLVDRDNNYYNSSQLRNAEIEEFFINQNIEVPFVSCQNGTPPSPKVKLLSLDQINESDIKARKGDGRAYVYKMFGKTYSWGEKRFKASYTNTQEENIALLDREDLRKLPIKISFSEIGARKFPIKGIMDSIESNPTNDDIGSFLSIDYNPDTKAIHVNALKDLGYIKLHNVEFSNKDKFPQTKHYPERHFIEYKKSGKSTRYCSNIDDYQMLDNKRSVYSILYHYPNSDQILIDASNFLH